MLSRLQGPRTGIAKTIATVPSAHCTTTVTTSIYQPHAAAIRTTRGPRLFLYDHVLSTGPGIDHDDLDDLPI